MFPTAWRSALAYLSGWPRRVAALLCLIMALLTALARGHAPPAATTLQTVVASRALTAGTVLATADLALIGWPASAVPAGAARVIPAVLGRRMAIGVGRGTPITTTELLEPAVAEALAAGQAAITVDLATTNQLALLRAGDHVDLYPAADLGQLAGSTPATAGSPVARNAEVLSVLAASDVVSDAKPALVVATDRAAAAQLAARSSAAFVATLVQPP